MKIRYVNYQKYILTILIITCAIITIFTIASLLGLVLPDFIPYLGIIIFIIAYFFVAIKTIISGEKEGHNMGYHTGILAVITPFIILGIITYILFQDYDESLIFPFILGCIIYLILLGNAVVSVYKKEWTSLLVTILIIGGTIGMIILFIYEGRIGNF